MENEYWLRGDAALQLEVSGRYGSFQLWINVWVSSKSVLSLIAEIKDSIISFYDMLNVVTITTQRHQTRQY